MANTKPVEAKQSTNHTPPVVSVLGHVDHGKTTLLDTIRKTSIADREHGGITQKIGASSVEVMHEGQKRTITFIDTPGHQAFENMRGRGAQVADIGLLIVSAVDSIMPQTRESIQLLRKAGIPFIVVITKVDLQTKNVEKVKGELAKEEVMLESMGGDVPVIEVSAKTGHNIKELLELILLVFDLHQPDKEKIGPQMPFKGVVIESKLDQKAGPRATVIIKNGTVSVRDEVKVDEQIFKVRSLIGSNGSPVQSASVGEGVELLGFTKAPSVGSVIIDKNAEAEHREKEVKEVGEYRPNAPESQLSVIICADTLGSLEAITASLPEDVYVVQEKTGDVAEADILLAKSTKSIVLGFNVKLRPEVQRLAMAEKVLVRNYTIIYELIDEVQDVIDGRNLALMEQVLGEAIIQATFPYEKTQAAGIKVREGRVARGDRVRIMRGEEIVAETTINSLRIGKNPTSKVEAGSEAGLLFGTSLDFRVGDMIISHS
jgi:translation initiation factor IF-2